LPSANSATLGRGIHGGLAGDDGEDVAEQEVLAAEDVALARPAPLPGRDHGVDDVLHGHDAGPAGRIERKAAPRHLHLQAAAPLAGVARTVDRARVHHHGVDVAGLRGGPHQFLGTALGLEIAEVQVADGVGRILVERAAVEAGPHGHDGTGVHEPAHASGPAGRDHVGRAIDVGLPDR
jgi:hypothetical protein